VYACHCPEGLPYEFFFYLSARKMPVEISARKMPMEIIMDRKRDNKRLNGIISRCCRLSKYYILKEGGGELSEPLIAVSVVRILTG